MVRLVHLVPDTDAVDIRYNRTSAMLRSILKRRAVGWLYLPG
jgi:hypothetical protein